MTAEPAPAAGSPGGHEDAPLAERMARELEPELWAGSDAEPMEEVPDVDFLPPVAGERGPPRRDRPAGAPVGPA